MIKFEEVCKEKKLYNNDFVKLPIRTTINSVGYDFFSPINIDIKPGTAELIYTNVKALFDSNVALILCVRSSMGKKLVCLANDIGLIDSDYYENIDNDGNLGFRLLNLSKETYSIKAGDKLGQGFFINYLLADNDVCENRNRVSGFGSTDNHS